jgi:dTDP-4-amino-4,6-dideoxygalactose transaminase
MMSYNPWPIGALPQGFAREELETLRSLDYEFADPREIISIFENKLAAYAGCKYAAVVDCASNGIFLSLKYRNSTGTIQIPRNTYISIPMQIYHAGCSVQLIDKKWSGVYELGTTEIFDSAARFTKDMFVGGENSLQVLSFQIKKRLPIGKGGAILTNSAEAYNWIKKASYDGRDLLTPYDSETHVTSIGWHMYMTPEDAARGIILMDKLGEFTFPDVANHESYPDITQWLHRIGIIA